MGLGERRSLSSTSSLYVWTRFTSHGGVLEQGGKDDKGGTWIAIETPSELINDLRYRICLQKILVLYMS